MPFSDTQRFPAACGTLAASLSKLADRRVVETHSASALPIAFKARAAPRLLDDPTWRMLTDSNRCLLQPHEFSKLVAARRGGSIHKMAESSDPASQTREGSLGLANQPGPRPVYSPDCWSRRRESNPHRSVKGRMHGPSCYDGKLVPHP
jgi:hypothetical protein